jgi:capsule biosynthesis phosphatase
MLLNKEIIIPIHIEETSHIGSYDEIMINFTVTPTFADKKLRICFDLDNTLVTYPTIPNDYSTVKPIPKMIHLLNSLKRKGHEIIIYTARRMKTHQNNVGKVIKDIALTTINTLTDLNIPYDELIFGKPIADIYIDDRAINPYINDISYFGIFNEKTDFIHNKVANNKYNSLKKINNIIKKNGPYQFLRGELFFYQNIPVSISHLFAKLISFNKIEHNLEISLDHIEGIPLYFLYKNKLITTSHIDSLFDVLKVFHSVDSPITIDDIHVHNNYFKKLQTRFNTNDYFFEDAQEVYDKIIDDLTKSYSPTIVGIIHGDFWFSNIIMEYNDNYKCIDMKGQVDNILTLNGDMYYDYGKLYQSILGYDLILNNCQLDIEYINSIKAHFLNKCREDKLNIDYLTAVTKSLIFGTFHSIEGNEIKQRVWDFLKKI